MKIVREIVVTGAAGFIGFHVVKALRARGEHVIGLDNFNPYYDVSLKRSRAAILQELGVDIIEADISGETVFKDVIQKYAPSKIIHLAAQAGARYWLKDPDSYMRSNVSGFYRLLEACKDHPSIRVIWASSSSVYGANKKIPFSVEDRTDEPTGLYAATKKCNEIMAYTYHHLFQMQLLGLRFFTVYGPWGRPDMAYFRFTESIAKGEPIDLYNFGKMRRDFTYIDDIVSGVLGALDCKVPYGLYNLGNSTPVWLDEFVEIIERHLGKKAHIRRVEMQPGEIVETYADISQSSRDFGFAPKTSLNDGIHNFIEWWKRYNQQI